MGLLPVLALIAGGAVGMFGPAAFVLMAFSLREKGHAHGARACARIGLGGGIVVYAALGLMVLLQAKNITAAGSFAGTVAAVLKAMPFWATVALAINFLACVGGWWVVGEAHRHADRAMAAAALDEARAEDVRRQEARRSPTASGAAPAPRG
jgi:hypothetical protein